MTNEYDFNVATEQWLFDCYQSQSLWLKRLLIALIVVSAFLLLTLLSQFCLFPLKEKVPYLYTFNNTTGEITTLGKLESSPITANWQLTRFLLIHYVMNRESYDVDNVELPYQLVYAMSSQEVQNRYEQEVSSDSSYSPYRLYGKEKYITVSVIAVNRLNDNTVAIRFNKILHDRNRGSEETSAKEAIMKWQFITPETTQKMLDRDPLGFKVFYYQVSPVNLENS